MKLKLTPPIAAVSVVAALLAGGAYGLVGAPSERVVFLAVGQGDCTLVQSDGRTMLIDVGPRAKSAVVPAVAHLRGLGVDRVDLILLSHPDADHIGGIEQVMAEWPSAIVEAPACFEHDDKMTDALQRAHVSPAQMRWTGGESGRFGRFEVQIRCHPWSEGEDDNFGSMIVKVSDGGASLVTTGDAPAEEEVDELGQAQWGAEIIHFGHHGSKTASSTPWLEAVHPVYGIVSCGRNNPYGHPHAQTLERAKAEGIEVHRTDREGDIEFDTAHGKFQLVR